MFDSGEAELKTEGERILQKIAGILAQYPKRQIHVIGHTDNVPIRSSARNRFPSNWELSTARATAAVRFLCENAGVDPRRLGAIADTASFIRSPTIRHPKVTPKTAGSPSSFCPRNWSALTRSTSARPPQHPFARKPNREPADDFPAPITNRIPSRAFLTGRSPEM